MVELIKLKNTARGVEIPLGQKDESYLLDYVNWGEVVSEPFTHKYPGQIGETRSGTFIGSREIEIVGWVVGFTEQEIRNQCSLLNSMINPLEELVLTFQDWKLTFYPDSSIQYEPGIEVNNEKMRKFIIEGLAPNPLFSDTQKTQVLAATTEKLMYFPLIIPAPDPFEDPWYPEKYKGPGVLFGLRKPSEIFPLENLGDVPIGIEVLFKALGTVYKPKIMDLNTGQFIQINKELKAGEEVLISTITGSKSVQGRGGISSQWENYYRYRDIYSSWLQLEPGTTLLNYSAEGNVDSLEVLVVLNNLYLEVE